MTGTTKKLRWAFLLYGKTENIQRNILSSTEVATERTNALIDR